MISPRIVPGIPEGFCEPSTFLLTLFKAET